MINETRLAMMKKGTILINVARGNVVDEAAVCKAVISGKLGGLGVDVYSTEPMPAAANPYAGGKSHPERSTTQSPRFTYPLSGDGILIIIVATQQSAASMEAVTTFCVFVFISENPFTKLFI